MSYEDIIKNAKLTYIKPPKNFKFSKNESHIGTLVIPKCGTDIRFRTGKYSLQLPKFKLSKEDFELPLSWQNYSDDKNSDKKFRLSTRPVNQGTCGSCFAVAISTCISDNFIFNPLNPLDYNPSISPMYILSCLKDIRVNNVCRGGNPSGVIDLIIDSGISTNCALDYYKMCTNNPTCDGPGNPDYDKKEDINKMIPECGYCASNPDIYYIKNKKIISYDIPSIKKHLMKYGTAIGGFMVFENFKPGHFSKTNGIYIKSVNYEDSNTNNTIGGHAICIVGWGVDTISFTDINNKTYNNKKIEYWICRNSWGNKWGDDNGYFKFAMYKNFDDLPPIQEGVALEKDNSYNGTPGLGGIILIYPDYIIKNTTLEKIDCDPKYECDKITYISDYKEDNKKMDKKMDKVNYTYIFILVGAIIIIFLLYFFYGKKHKRRRSKSRS